MVSQQPIALMQRGQLVGNDYLLQKILSQGPCGVFWRALDQKRGQLVGIWFLPEAFLENAEAMDRFRRQFDTVQTFQHPHVVTPECFIEDQADGVCWVARLVDGPSLDEYIRQRTQVEGQFPSRLAFDILRSIASALDEARERRLVHRSLSPATIVVHPTEGVRIVDFELTGIVRESLEPAILTDAKEQSRFLAPEQIDGRGASPYSDQYALGAIAYELLGGRYQGPDAVLLPLLDQPEYVNQTLQRAMHRDPAERFPSCREFVCALECVQSPQEKAAQNVADLPKPPALDTLTPFEIIASAASEAKATSITQKIHRERRLKRLFDLWTIALLIGIIAFVAYNWEKLARHITGSPNSSPTTSTPGSSLKENDLNEPAWPNFNTRENNTPKDGSPP